VSGQDEPTKPARGQDQLVYQDRGGALLQERTSTLTTDVRNLPTTSRCRVVLMEIAGALLRSEHNWTVLGVDRVEIDP
jgi:hypothetical protein